MSDSIVVPTSTEQPAAASNTQAAPSSVWAFIRLVRREITLGIALAALSAVTSLGALLCIAPIIAALLEPQPAAAQISNLLLLALVLTALTFTLRTFAFRISHMGAFRLEQILRTQLTEHLARVPLGYLVTTGAGALKKVVHDDVKALHAFVADSTPLMGRGYASPLVTIIALLLIDWRMALVSLAVLPFGMFSMRLAMRDYATLSQQYNQANERINAAVIEFVQAMPVVRTFDDGTTSFRRYNDALTNFSDLYRRWSRTSSIPGRLGMLIMSPLPTLIVVAAVGSWMFLQGALSFPTLVAVLLLCTGVAESLMPLMWMTRFIQQAEVSAGRIHALLAVPSLPAAPHPQQPQDSSLSLRDVSFAYEGRTKDALERVSIEVPPGSVTALVGPSGAGKSTVARLIPRFWDVSAGSIAIGGVDVRDLSAATLMQHVSFVFQDTFLFHDTIAANIKLGRPDADMAQVEAAAQAAQAHAFIQELPEGYATIVGERGARLSGGQRQRITLARAILQNNPIVVLDEATAFADPENEAMIVAALANLMRDKTVVVIAHRLATIVDADQIVVLDQGRVVERGRHAQLSTANGLYARLWANYQQARDWGLRGGAAVNS